MCLVAVAIDQSRRFPLVIASNRDESFGRPTAGLAWWTPQPGAAPVLGGRDLESGGTWMGVTQAGRVAILTNLRAPATQPIDAAAPSRGRIAVDWLTSRERTDRFWMRTVLSGYNGFNLIAADFARDECFWGSNTGAPPQRLAAGLYGLSNGALDAPWPKSLALKRRVAGALDSTASVDVLADHLFDALGDRRAAPDTDLPRTGIAIERERLLSPAFIATPDRSYGTRCSTLLVTDRSRREAVTHVIERSFDGDGRVVAEQRVRLPNWPPARDVSPVARAGSVATPD